MVWEVKMFSIFKKAWAFFRRNLKLAIASLALSLLLFTPACDVSKVCDQVKSDVEIDEALPHYSPK